MGSNGNGEFHIGDRVVYPNHGVGIVEQIGTRTLGQQVERYYLLNIKSSNLKVTIPFHSVSIVGLRRVVRDDVDLFFRQERFEVGFRHVRLDQPRSCRDLFGAAGGQVVHDDDPVSVREVASRHVRADEARTARHHDVHRLVA